MTERDAAARRALHDSEERLQLALRAGRSGAWDWDMVRNVSEVTPSYRELFGLAPTAPVDYATWLGAVHPDDRERCRRYGEAFFGGSDTEWDLEFRILAPGLGVRWHHAIGRLYRDPGGRPLRFVGVSTDVTEKQQALAALRESEERFRAMADDLPLIIWVHDADGRQQFVNRTFLEYFGVTEEEMKGERWQLLMHPDDADAYSAEFLACVRERRPFHADVRVRNAEGAWRTIESWGRPRFSAAGEFLGFIGTSADVTERRRMEQALRDADRRKDEFLAMLGHELRNPLATIGTAMDVFAQLLPASDARLTLVREAAQRQIDVLKRLVDDLLDAARVATGKIELQRRTVALHDVLHAAADGTRAQMVERGHRFAIDEPGEALHVDGDEVRLVQVVSNLLGNAARYTPRGGHVALVLERDGDNAVIRVRDDGVGVPPHMLDDVFGLFVQAGAAPDASERGGLGIGLTLVRRLVELHGGSVVATSDGAGRGSEFVVRLPLAAPAAAAAEPSSATPAALSSARRVLIVDDNRDAAASLALLLELLGHDARQVHSGRAALDAAVAFRPHVVVLDIGLPDLDGHEVARRLRTLEGGHALRIVAASGFAPAPAGAAPSAIDHHLVKPIDLAELERVLQP